MKNEKNRLKQKTQFLKIGFVYLFIFLLINVGFSSVYKVAGEKSSMQLVAEEENHSEDSKKLSELHKEYFSSRNNHSAIQFTLKENNFFFLLSKHLSHFPEKDSPPPKSFHSIS